MSRLFDALAEVVPASQIGPWLDIPNPAFEGSTPLQVSSAVNPIGCGE
jgi:hypothetical protein